MKNIHSVFSVSLIVLLCSFLSDKWTSATYPGGDAAMQKYLKDSVRYPEAAVKNGEEGIVEVEFTISTTGAVVNPKTTMYIGSSQLLRDEVCRLVTAMPLWTPATDKHGKPREGSDRATVRFQLPDSLAHLLPPSDDTTTYDEADQVDSVPAFPGGENGRLHYLQNEIRYPKMERENNIQGTVYVSYVVGKNGLPENVYVARGIPNGSGLDKESVRVVNTFPRYRPAIKNGKAVKYRLIVPFKYVLM